MNAHDFRTMVIFDKQVQFIDMLMPVLHEVNCYVTTLDVWLGEAGRDARKQLKRALKKNTCVTLLQGLLDQYYVYIPEELSNEINQFHFDCVKLENAQTQDATAQCTARLFALQDNIRTFIQHNSPVKGAR
jgi:hypothetical protein